jgi:hypothetical protein
LETYSCFYAAEETSCETGFFYPFSSEDFFSSYSSCLPEIETGCDSGFYLFFSSS